MRFRRRALSFVVKLLVHTRVNLKTDHKISQKSLKNKSLDATFLLISITFYVILAVRGIEIEEFYVILHLQSERNARHIAQ